MRLFALILALLTVALAGCGRNAASDSQLYSKTPEEAIQRAFDFCREGNYSEGVRVYANGPQLWQSNPGMAKEMVDRACFTYQGTATRYVIQWNRENGEGAEIGATTYVHAADDPKSKLELNPWRVTLVKRQQGWLIAE